MSYKNDDISVVLMKYGKASSTAKAELYETYDRLRDLAVSGPTMGGSGLGKFGSFLMNVARTFGATQFMPTFGSESVNIPGTSYYAPISGGVGIEPGGQAAFGLAPFSQVTGLPTGGAAPVGWSSLGGGSSGFASGGLSGLANLGMMGLSALGLSTLGLFSSRGVGALPTGNSSVDFSGLGDPHYPFAEGSIGGVPANGIAAGGIIAGGASAVGTAATGAGLAAGAAAGAGFGRNWVMPAAGIVSGIGGLLTTLGPFFGPYGIAGAAAGSILNGAAGAVLASFQHVGNRVLSNADNILTNKVKNLETTIKMLDAQQDILKKLLKESLEGDKKALDNL
ncbi:MAG: hypothetical protein SFZ03_08930 [Candidatus Melainabacteria bacterium]|nr:hypothetical protein [Candidatus Melainabacteria bacterium]